MKDHVVLAVEEENLGLGATDLAAKSPCELYCGKAPSNNDYSDWLHFLAPVVRAPWNCDFFMTPPAPFEKAGTGSSAFYLSL